MAGTVTLKVSERFDGQTPDGDLLPRGRIVRIDGEIILPAAATHNQVMEWVKFNMGWGSIKTSNPLHEYEVELNGEPILRDSGSTTDLLDQRDAALMKE